MPHAPFLFMSWLTSCLPSPCRRLSRPRTTTKAPLPCRIFSVIFLGVLILEIFHLAALRIAGRFRRSGLGNLQLNTLGKAYCDVGVGFRPFPLIAAGCHIREQAAQVVELVHRIALADTVAKAAEIAVMLGEEYLPAADAVHADGLQRLPHGLLCGGEDHPNPGHLARLVFLPVCHQGGQYHVDPYLPPIMRSGAALTHGGGPGP